MHPETLPLLDASLNAVAALFLSLGYLQIRRRRQTVHRAFMIAAFVTSTLFLVSYTVYHARVGSKPFPGHGPLRAVYFTILISHILLAAAVPPLAIVTLWRAAHGRFSAHARLARWTLPVWLYVSVTGVVVYVLLYRL